MGVAIKIGPVSAKFAGEVTLQDIDPPNGYALVFDAQGGVAGFGKGESKVTLTDNAQGCELHYTVQSRIGGKLAQLGQRLIDGAAKSLAEDFFRRFDEALQAQYPRSEATAAPAPAPAADKATPTWLWVAGGLVVVAAIWALTR